MSNDLLKYAFVAGELSPTLLGRTDLTKYDLAMAEAYNFFVDYRGGLSSRPGTEFVDFLPDYAESDRVLQNVPAPFVFPMKIEADTEYNYMLVVSPVDVGGSFSHSIIRFVQNGEFNLEPSFPVSAISYANPLIITSVGHNFINGDWVRFSDSTNLFELKDTSFIVRNVSGDNFNLEFVATGNLVNGTVNVSNTGGAQGRIARVYTIECDYQPDDYASMKWDQHGYIVRITHRAYPIRNLVWYYDGSLSDLEDQYGKGWSLFDETIGVSGRGPAITGSSASDTGDAQVVFAVTSVYEGDEETVRGPAFLITGIVNYTATEGSVSVTWAADPDALYYNVYRSIVSVTETLTSGTELGFVGRSRGTKFTDNNIIPDFGRTPPNQHNPFAPNRVAGLTITDGGSGYADFTTLITLTGSVGDGADFIAEGVVDEAGVIVNTVIINEGHDYNFPPTSTLDISGAGSGATIDIITNTDIGEQYTYPGCSAFYQQRQLYASTFSLPVNLWGSQVGLQSNFDTTPNVTDSDSFSFALDTSFYAPLRHLIATQAGLIAMTQETVWLVNGGGPTEPLTAQNVVATPQNYSGAGIVSPIKIGGDILYTEGKGYAVRMLSYNEVSRNFTADDRSILSSHLFQDKKEIVSWAYQEQPFKVVWVVRGDGALLAFTTVKSEDIYAWTSGGTKGQFLAVGAMREATAAVTYSPAILDIVDSVYFVVQRKFNGVWRRVIERMAQRTFVNLEDAWCLDCAKGVALDKPDTSLTFARLEPGLWGVINDTGSDFFGVGDVLRAAGGIFECTGFTDPYFEFAEIEPPKDFVPETEDVVPVKNQEWTLSYPTDTFYALWHLEGETVSVFADGKILDDQVVANGQVVLPEPATKVLLGTPFTCRARTLPLTAQGAPIEGKRKRIPALAVRVEKTKGLKAGMTGGSMYDVERGGEATVMKNGVLHELVNTSWEDDASLTFLQDKPLPVTMLSLITEVEVGDDSD